MFCVEGLTQHSKFESGTGRVQQYEKHFMWVNIKEQRGLRGKLGHTSVSGPFIYKFYIK